MTGTQAPDLSSNSWTVDSSMESSPSASNSGNRDPGQLAEDMQGMDLHVESGLDLAEEEVKNDDDVIGEIDKFFEEKTEDDEAMKEDNIYEPIGEALKKCSTVGVYIDPYVPPQQNVLNLNLNPYPAENFAIIDVSNCDNVENLTQALVNQPESMARMEFVTEYIACIEKIFAKKLREDDEWISILEHLLTTSSLDDLITKDKLVARWFVHEDMVDHEGRDFDRQCFDLNDGEALKVIFRQRDGKRSLKLRVAIHFASGLVLPARIIGRFFQREIGELIKKSGSDWKIPGFGSMKFVEKGDVWVMHPQNRWNEILVPGDPGTLDLFPEDIASHRRNFKKTMAKISEMEIKWNDIPKSAVSEYVSGNRIRVKITLNKFESYKTKGQLEGMELIKQQFYGHVFNWRKNKVSVQPPHSDHEYTNGNLSSNSGATKRSSEEEDDLEEGEYVVVTRKKTKMNSNSASDKFKFPYHPFFEDCIFGTDQHPYDTMKGLLDEGGRGAHIHVPVEFFDRHQERTGFSLVKGFFERARYYKAHRAFTLNLKAFYSLQRQAGGEKVPWKIARVEPEQVNIDRDTWTDKENTWFSKGIIPSAERRGFRGWSRHLSSLR